jgi:hypothetical protein
LFVTAKSFPVAVIELIVKGADWLLVTVMDWGELVLPTICAEKTRPNIGRKLTGAKLFPLIVMLCGELLASSVTTRGELLKATEVGV